MTRRASCGLMYGGMNSTKTTNLGRIARYLFDRYGLTSRLISADNEYDTLEPEIDAGIIEPFAIVNIPNPFSTLTKLSKGMWPGVVKRGSLSVLEMAATPPDRMAKIGAYLIEGTTTIAEMLHQDHIRNARSIGEDVVGKFVEDGITFAKSARSHYQQVQDYVTLDLIPTFSMLPVRWVWWTGHEYTGEDEATGQTRLGPGVIGKAATMRVPRKVGNTFHLVMNETIKLDPQTKKNSRTLEYRAYFEPHASGIGTIMWPAGVKIPVDWVPKWRERFAEGFIPLQLNSGIEQYLKFVDDMSEASGKSRAVFEQTQANALAASIMPPEQSEKPTGPSVLVPTASTAAPAAPAQATQTRPAVQPIRRPMVPPRPGPLPTPRFASAGISRPPTSGFAAQPRQPIQRPGAPVTTPPDKLAETLEKSIEQVTGAPVNSVPVIPDINAIPGEPPSPSEPPAVNPVPNQREESKTDEVKQ